MAPSRRREARRTWGQRVEGKRTALNWTQVQLGEIANLPQQTISRVELDLVVPRYGTMAALARALGTTVEELFPVDSYPERLKLSRKGRKVRT